MDTGNETWFRGCNCSTYALLPSLFRNTADFTQTELDWIEQDAFFAFQARARELHERGLTDWDYLFFMRHHGVPTRILDWTDSFGHALYFALETTKKGSMPCVWVLNPYRLNERTFDHNDLVQPKYLVPTGKSGSAYLDYGDALIEKGRWQNDGPVAIYPLQIADRMRAQRGWFTFHGNDRRPLEAQYPEFVARIDLAPKAVTGGKRFLRMAGLLPYTVYPDLEHLGKEIWSDIKRWMRGRKAPASRRRRSPGASGGRR